MQSSRVLFSMAQKGVSYLTMRRPFESSFQALTVATTTRITARPKALAQYSEGRSACQWQLLRRWSQKATTSTCSSMTVVSPRSRPLLWWQHLIRYGLWLWGFCLCAVPVLICFYDSSQVLWATKAVHCYNDISWYEWWWTVALPAITLTLF